MEITERSEPVPAQTLILGVGNLLLSDEGVGVHASHELMKMKLPPGISVVEGGTGGLNLLNLIHDVDRLIVIDAVKGEEAPGSVYRLDMDEIREHACGLITSVHSLGVREVLDLCALLGREPLTTVIGVEPKSLAVGTELSPEVKAKMPLILRMVLQELQPAANQR